MSRTLIAAVPNVPCATNAVQRTLHPCRQQTATDEGRPVTIYKVIQCTLLCWRFWGEERITIEGQRVEKIERTTKDKLHKESYKLLKYLIERLCIVTQGANI
jgi:hypothetical protein